MSMSTSMSMSMLMCARACVCSLAGPGLPGNEYHEIWHKRLLFGLNLFVRFPPIVALSMMVYAVTFSLEYGPTLLRSFATPLFGGDYPDPLDKPARDARLTSTYVTGDVAAKREALEMLKAGNGEASPQVAALADEEKPSAGGGGGGAAAETAEEEPVAA